MSDECCNSLLQVSALTSGYGKKVVLSGIDLHIDVGEIVAVIGHNGAGKSTLLKAIFGLIPIWQGVVSIRGVVRGTISPAELIADGVAYIPQGSRVFGDLTVRENLEMSALAVRDVSRRVAAIESALKAFPALHTSLNRLAGTLSGGQKQILALASAFVRSPKLFLLDEPSLGLAPAATAEALNAIKATCEGLGASVLVVEQKVREVLKIAHRVYVLRNGRVSYAGPVADIAQNDERLRQVYL